uniref:Uncharacterized protein n=1 Tax=Rhizophora mucronata TaxID=61149 RepID=A0A2P2QCP6_RHIMU
MYCMVACYGRDNCLVLSPLSKESRMVN